VPFQKDTPGLGGSIVNLLYEAVKNDNDVLIPLSKWEKIRMSEIGYSARL
jgi:hypothetical protein